VKARGLDIDVRGANGSFSSRKTQQLDAEGRIDLIGENDPVLTASKAAYVEHGQKGNFAAVAKHVDPQTGAPTITNPHDSPIDLKADIARRSGHFDDGDFEHAKRQRNGFNRAMDLLRDAYAALKRSAANEAYRHLEKAEEFLTEKVVVPKKLSREVSAARDALPNGLAEAIAHVDTSFNQLREMYVRMDNELQRTIVGPMMNDENAKGPLDDKTAKDYGVNQFAPIPAVGEGYTISGSGRQSVDAKQWNHHWAAEVLHAANGPDHMTLENFSVGNYEAENDKWSFQMYGTDPGQTFHEQYASTGELGAAPITMTVANPKTT
jgi:hypothetical protein